tara:strand:- start:1488 stop:2180 length:693 start_codon:yes stop_codon:yes gene_type:complete
MRKSVLILLIVSNLQADNQISITQSGGASIDLKVFQFGADNTVQMYDTYSYVNGDNMNLTLIQQNDSNTENKIELWHLDGNNNTVRWAQGTAWDSATSTTYGDDGNEGGGHYARLDIHGDSNHLQGHQTNQGSTSGHTFTSLVFSDNNDIWLRQQGDGAKTINLTTYNDGNDISVLQKGAWAEHTANITLSGSDATTLNLRQQGTTTQSYSLSQNCVTVGGCSVSVTQGQ